MANPKKTNSVHALPNGKPCAPVVMGVLNVTPDSFSDGGEFLSVDAATERAIGMIEEGASIIDVGAESTRPGAQPVPRDVQCRRATPVIEAIRKHTPDIIISIDTRLAPVAKAAISAGANMVNDVSALRDDPAMVNVIAAAKVEVVLMHMHGTPATMQAGGGPEYDNVVDEIVSFLRERTEFAVANGIDRNRIVLDPGLGFGKKLEHNLQILRDAHRFTEAGLRVLFGASRKSFVGRVLDIADPTGREAGSLACALIAAVAGASIIRTHDVRPTVDALRVWSAVRNV